MWQNKRMRAYSQNLRQRILRAIDQGKPYAEVIKTFVMSRSTIKRYLKLRRETGNVKPRGIPGRPSKKGAALDAESLPQLEAPPMRDGRVSRMKPTVQPGGSKPNDFLQIHWYSLMNTARTLPSLACLLDLREGNGPLVLFHAIDVRTSHSWLRSRFREWVTPSFWKARQIAPCLNAPSNRFWLRVSTQGKCSSWTI